MTIAISLLNENNHKNTGDGGNDDSVPGLKRELGTRVSSVVHLSVRVIALMHHVNRSVFVFVFVFVSVYVCVMALTYHAIHEKLLNWKTIQINFKF